MLLAAGVNEYSVITDACHQRVARAFLTIAGDLKPPVAEAKTTTTPTSSSSSSSERKTRSKSRHKVKSPAIVVESSSSSSPPLPTSHNSRHKTRDQHRRGVAAAPPSDAARETRSTVKVEVSSSDGATATTADAVDVKPPKFVSKKLKRLLGHSKLTDTCSSDSDGVAPPPVKKVAASGAGVAADDASSTVGGGNQSQPSG